MTQLTKKFVSVLAAALLVAPQAYATELLVTGNGAEAESEIKFSQTTTTALVQSNVADVNNSVKTESSTGGNSANDNTGGDVIIRTGDAKAYTTIENSLNQNFAELDCCEAQDVEVTISGNGYRSENDVELDLEDTKGIFQTNVAGVTNDVETKAKTGYNDANRTTGGDVTIRTGDATAVTDVTTSANANNAAVGGRAHHTGSLSAWILGNGAYSENEIELDITKEMALVQENLAEIENSVETYGSTGKNEASDNTGGEVGIWTGDAKAATYVDNMVNFNAADIDCGCVLDTTAKVAQNGAESENEIEADLKDVREYFQDGTAVLGNDVDSKAKTGWNESDYNTGSVEGSDPFIYTGDAYSSTDVGNSSNMNMFGGEWDMPEVEFSFNWAHFTAVFGM